MIINTFINYIGAFTLALTTTTGHATFYTGNDMSKFCGTSETSSNYYDEQARCSGYIIGVVDTITQVDAYDDDICLPEMVTVGQLTKVVEKFMLDNPAEMHWPGVRVIGFALFDAFPCD